MRRPADGSRQAEPLTTLRGRVYLDDVTADGRTLIVNIFGVETRRTGALQRSQIASLAVQKAAMTGLAAERGRRVQRPSVAGRPLARVRGPHPATRGVRAPDDRQWAVEVSTSGGEEPRWSSDGRTLYYRNDNVPMAVAVNAGTAFESSVPMQVLKGIFNLRSESGISYEVDSNADRFLMLRLGDEAADSLSLRVITNWTRDLPEH